MIEIEFDSRDIEHFLDSMTMKKLSRTVSRSLNEAARATRAEAVKRVRREKNIKNPRKQMHLFKSTPSFLQSLLRIADYQSPLINFKARRVIVPTAKGKRIGVKVEVTKGKRVLVEGGFIAETKHRVGIFKRQGKGRDKITHLLGSSVYNIFSETKFANEMRNFAQAKFDKSFSRNLKFYFRGL